jgi:hypothetical protein
MSLSSPLAILAFDAPDGAVFSYLKGACSPPDCSLFRTCFLPVLKIRFIAHNLLESA